MRGVDESGACAQQGTRGECGLTHRWTKDSRPASETLESAESVWMSRDVTATCVQSVCITDSVSPRSPYTVPPAREEQPRNTHALWPDHMGRQPAGAVTVSFGFALFH